MYHIRLRTAEHRALTHALETTANQRLQRRYQAVVMVHQGYSRQRIAADLDIHRTTLTQWLRKYRTGGLTSNNTQWRTYR